MGVREGPAPQKAGKIGSQRSSRKEAAWRRKKKEEQVGMMKRDRREQSEQLFYIKKIVTNVIMCNCSVRHGGGRRK